MTEWSRDFQVEEFKCKCCGALAKRDKLVELLQKVRDKLGKPIVIHSGTRCNAHNRDVGGSDTSSHLDGLAADISCDDNFTLLRYCLQVFKRVGIAKDYLHVDIDDKKPQGVYWVYQDGGKRTV